MLQLHVAEAKNVYFFVLDGRDWDFEEGQKAFEAGNITKHVEFWHENLKAPEFVLSILKHGHFLPFETFPPPSTEHNNKSSLRNKKFVEDSIRQLLLSGCIEQVTEVPHCVNPLTVAEGKKLRLVLDLRSVNKYLNVTKFKYENLRTVADIIDKDDFFVTFDLKNGYHHVPIAKEHQTYLGFAWDFIIRNELKKKYFVFVVLAFGLAPASYVFSKVMRPLVKKWRRMGKKSLMYLDNGILASESYNRTKEIARVAREDMEKAGITINTKKSKFEPTQRGIYLGFIIDTQKMEFVAPAEKIDALKVILQEFVTRDTATPKEISRIAGRIISLAPAIGSLTRLFSRHLYKFIESRDSWHQRKTVTREVREELNFWARNLEGKNGHKIRANPIVTRIVYSDASDKGYGGYMVQRLGNVVAQGRFSEQEKDTSSTHRELLAVRYILQSFQGILRNETIQWHSDNTNVGKIIQGGSTKPDLQKIALQIYDLCIANNNKILSIWVPREENIIADFYSRPNDTDDFTIDYATFEFIQRKLGRCTVDRFADDKNAKLERFNSRYFCPNTEAVNAFACDWHSEVNWLCPPIKLIGDTIKHARECKSKGILLVPFWESSYFYPIIWDGYTFRSFIKKSLAVNPFYHSSAINSVFKGYAAFESLALLIDFSGC